STPALFPYTTLFRSLGAGGILRQQLVADVVEIADDGHRDADAGQPVANAGNGLGGLVAVDGDTDQLGAGTRQRRHLPRGRLHVRSEEHTSELQSREN